MNWKYKFLASFVLSKTPFSMPIYNQLQKHVTKRWERNVRSTLLGKNNYTTHLEAFLEHWGDLSTATYYEFGVARDLFSNLLNWCCGINHQLAIDLNPLATHDLVEGSRLQLCDLTHPMMTRAPEHPVGKRFKEGLRDKYGIDYRAPADARCLDAEAGSLDLMATTSTFEHIRPEMIPEILAECHRLCHVGSIMSHVVDYHDHYAHGDPSITPYNFLRFSEREWERYHMRHYYQNRLRHNEIRQMFTDAGFEVIREIRTIPANAENMLATVPLSSQFDGYAREDLLATSGHFVLKMR